MNVYLISAVGSNALKIGKADSVRNRIASFRTGCPFPIELVDWFKGGLREEAALHSELRDYRMIGEWFADCEKVRETFRNWRIARGSISLPPPQPPPQEEDSFRSWTADPIEARGMSLRKTYSFQTFDKIYAALQPQWFKP